MGVRGPVPLLSLRADEARWKALVLPIPSRRLLRHTLLRPATSSDDLWSWRSSRHDRSPVILALRQQRPGGPGGLVGKRHGDQHARLARQHLLEPRALGGAALA